LNALTSKGSGQFVFGPFVLIPERRLLLQGGSSVKLGRRAFDILLALVARSGQVVSKRELISLVWPDGSVEEGNLKVNIAALRHILSQDSGESRYIATVAGRGYKFVSSVETSTFVDRVLITGSASERHNNLPDPIKRIFGRAETIASILEDLKNYRLVSVVGLGGVGKTTVALAAAHGAGTSFGAGVWLVDFAPVSDPSRVLDALAAAIGVYPQSTDSPAPIYEHLRSRHLLLVLDNCEHLVDDIASLADRILNDAKHVKLLATSREPLSIKGERVRRIFGLGVPPRSDQMSADGALAFPAVQLFADRASNGAGKFDVTDANARVITEICCRLDGLPLAIERVAMRIDHIGVFEMLAHLDNDSYMSDDYHTGPDRHRTLEATIDSTYRLLATNEQALMRKLATFAGPFSLDSACFVAAAEEQERSAVVDAVATLVAKSLLAAESRDGEMQYRQNNITRAFALAKLTEHGELDTARRRHAERMLGLVERENAERGRPGEADDLSLGGAILPEIDEALDWAFCTPLNASLAIRLVLAALPLWLQHSITDKRHIFVARALEDRYSAFRDARDEVTLTLALGASPSHESKPDGGARSVFLGTQELTHAKVDTYDCSEAPRLLSKPGSHLDVLKVRPNKP
jgi:predicted ATPase/DNA-binding winged helix-turn-helix (wHTH) protein